MDSLAWILPVLLTGAAFGVLAGDFMWRLRRRPITGRRTRAIYVHLTTTVELLKSRDLWKEAECVRDIREELFPRSYQKLDGNRWFSHTNGAKTRNAFTLVEALVVLAILATLVGLLAPAFMAAMDNAASREPQSHEPPESIWLSTVKHDGHWFVCKGENCCLHHPDCPCRDRTAEDTTGDRQ